MNININQISSISSEFELAKQIRHTVFIAEQKVDENEEYDQFEDSSTHFLAYFDDNLAGTCRFRKIDNGYKLERFAVLKEYRQKGVGTALVQACLKAIPKGSYCKLHAQLDAMPLYKKNGFTSFGELFYECEIPHYAMKLINP